MSYDWKNALKLEQRVQYIISEQSRLGWDVDTVLLDKIIFDIEEELDSINADVLPRLPKKYKVVGKPVSRIKVKSGDYSDIVKRWFKDDLLNLVLYSTVEGEFTRIQWEDIDIGSSHQIKTYFLTQGWQPTEWNYKKDSDGKFLRDHNRQRIKASPKLTEDSFDSISGDAPALVAKGLKLRNRLGVLRGWKSQVTSEGKIHSFAFTCGAVTARMRHAVIVNVPGTEALLGKELRSIFTVPDKHYMVGCDASGCQLRMLASAMNVTNDFTNAILYGTKEDRNDPHFVTADMAGGLTRHQGKTLNYSILFGQSDAALARALGVSEKRAKQIKATFFRQVPELPLLINDLEAEWSRSSRNVSNRYIVGLDGRKIYVNSKHKILNFKLQSDEAIAMKTALCFLYKWMEDRVLDSRLLIFYHDEFQLQVPEKELEIITELSPKSIVKSGQYLKLNVPLAAEVNVGRNWMETH